MALVLISLGLGVLAAVILAGLLFWPERRIAWSPDRGAFPVSAEPASPGSAAADETEKDPDQPHLIEAPMEGSPDALTSLRGLGPKTEEKLHALGVFYFDQVASWTPEQTQWIDREIGAKGRVIRENWPAQARERLVS